MHRRFKMPKPEIPVMDPNWTEGKRREYMKRQENAYLEKMKGEQGLFVQALAAEVAADDEQTTYALRTFYKCFLKQKEGVMAPEQEQE